jgi:hypothetical protein
MAVGEERERTRMDEEGGDNEPLRFECLFCSRFPHILNVACPPPPPVAPARKCFSRTHRRTGEPPRGDRDGVR